MLSAWKLKHPDVELTLKTIKTKSGFNTKVWMETDRAVTYRETTNMDIIEDEALIAILDEMYEELKESKVD